MYPTQLQDLSVTTTRFIRHNYKIYPSQLQELKMYQLPFYPYNKGLQLILFVSIKGLSAGADQTNFQGAHNFALQTPPLKNVFIRENNFKMHFLP